MPQLVGKSRTAGTRINLVQIIGEILVTINKLEQTTEKSTYGRDLMRKYMGMKRRA